MKRTPTDAELEELREAMISKLKGHADMYWLLIVDSFCRVHGLKDALSELREQSNLP